MFRQYMLQYPRKEEEPCAFSFGKSCASWFSAKVVFHKSVLFETRMWGMINAEMVLVY